MSVRILFFLIFFFSASVFADVWGAVPAFYSQYATFGIEQLGLGTACGPMIPSEPKDLAIPAFTPENHGNNVQADILSGRGLLTNFSVC